MPVGSIKYNAPMFTITESLDVFVFKDYYRYLYGLIFLIYKFFPKRSCLSNSSVLIEAKYSQGAVGLITCASCIYSLVREKEDK